MLFYWKYAYNTRSELTSAIKHLHKPASEVTEDPLAGHQWTYDYDDIGNRTQMKSGGDKDGENLEAIAYGDGTKSGAANALNQYTAINNRTTFDITGTGTDAASVTISNAGTTPSVEAQPESATPKQRFRFKVPSASTNTNPSWNAVTVTGSASDTKAGNHYVPSLEEQPQYDKDGNLIEDARWHYRWNGENRLIEMETTTDAKDAGVPKQKLQFTYGPSLPDVVILTGSVVEVILRMRIYFSFRQSTSKERLLSIITDSDFIAQVRVIGYHHLSRPQ